MAETHAILAWTLQQETPTPEQLLVEGEQAVASFKTFPDSATFTTKRLIVRDAQGLTGRKIEIYSLPYASIVHGLPPRRVDTVRTRDSSNGGRHQRVDAFVETVTYDKTPYPERAR